MSMLSAQIDELRNAAEFYDGFKAADLMREAADTIWQLRDDLQRTNVENSKLRELIYSRAHRFALQNMTEDELRIVATNLLDQLNKCRELFCELGLVMDD